MRTKPLCCQLNLYADQRQASTLANTSATSSLPDKRCSLYLLFWYWYKRTTTDAAGAVLSSGPLTSTSAMALLQNTSVASVGSVSLAQALAPAGSQVLR